MKKAACDCIAALGRLTSGFDPRTLLCSDARTVARCWTAVKWSTILFIAIFSKQTAQGGNPMEEKIFFSYDDVKVTSSRFISGGQTFAMSNITSVKAFEQKPNRFWAILIMFFGILLTITFLPVGLTMIGASAIYMIFQKTTFHVMLATAGGETSALTTYQKDYLDQVVAALNEAIVYRG